MLIQILKKFFIVAIFLSFANCQIAFAENWNIPVDWSKVQKISSKSDLAQYLENKKRTGQNIIPVILTNGLTITSKEFLELCPSSLVDPHIISNDGQTIRVIYETTEYPGTKVANAYLSGDTSKLSQDEMKLYKEAVKIIDETKKETGWQAREMHIYYTIMKRTTYYTAGQFNNQPRYCTAIGALLDGKANCQGYSDAFYMLCRMMKWEVGRMSGTAGGGAHMWNTITFNSGKANEKTYCVDVTWGDDALEYKNRTRKMHSYIYFNAPLEIMQVTHSWSWDLAPTIQGGIDDVYSYSNFPGSFARTSSAEAGLKLLAKKIANGNTKWFSVMTPYEKKFAYAKDSTVWNYFKNELSSLGYTGKHRLYVHNFGKYIFYTADTYDN